MIKQYFRELYVSRSYNVEINSKRFVTEFEIYWRTDFQYRKTLYVVVFTFYHMPDTGQIYSMECHTVKSLIHHDR
jgi:hypothetical protein